MKNKNILKVWDLFYVNPEEIADADNASEVINQYKGDQQIPIRILELDDRREIVYMILAGEGALYPWENGQRVEIASAHSFIRHIEYLSKLCEMGIDNTPYQNFILCDSIKPIRRGEYYPDKDAKEYKGLSSFEIYREFGEILLNNENYKWKL